MTLSIVDLVPEFIESEAVDFRVGNNVFSDDVWDFQGFHVDPGAGTGGMFQIRFAPIKQPLIKSIIKQFLVYDLMQNGMSTAKRNYDGFKRFYYFLEEQYPEIKSLTKLNPIILRRYFQSLLEGVSKTSGNPLTRAGIVKSSQVVKDLLLMGSTRGWAVPKDSSWVLPMYNEMIISSPKVISSRKTTKKMFSDEIISKIISCALKEPNLITKAGIIIQTQVGLRINELLSLRTGCINQIGNKIKIEHWTRKTKKGMVRRIKPANQLVAEVVKELEAATEHLRKDSGLPYLFISQTQRGGIQVCNKSNWNRNYLQPFVKSWDIRENGEFIDLSSHYFRHIFATWAHRKGMPIQSILKMFDHATLQMTETYDHINLQDFKAKAAEIFSEDALIAGVSVGRIKNRLKNDNPFKGKTQRQVELIIKAMRISILANGVCFHHPARKDPCAEDGDCVVCPNFVTTPEFIPVNKARVKALEDEMDRAQRAGNEVWHSKNRLLRDHIQKHLIQPLEQALAVRGVAPR